MKAFTLMHRANDKYLVYITIYDNDDDVHFDTREDGLFYILLHGTLRKESHVFCPADCPYRIERGT